MNVILTQDARDDLLDAVEWYNLRASAAADRFNRGFEALLLRIENNPQQFPIVRGGVRRAIFDRFPYNVYFRLHDDRAEIFACLHSSRNPRAWQRRQ